MRLMSWAPPTVAPKSERNSAVTIEIAEPMSARFVLMRVPARVEVAR